MSLLKAFLMEQQKIMYATIKGTLTENNGVFSGFSGTNYLELQNNIDTTQDYEIVVKFVNSTSKYHSVILGSNSTANSIKIEISYGTRFFIFLSSNGTSWNIANGAYGLTNAMSLGNTYYMKLTYSSVNGYKLFLSTDKINWSLQWSIGTTNALYMTNTKFILGASLFDNNSLGGSIDLNNNSYIKLGSTKYKLQAVVGYTIVGSPTIVDGVVSGFRAYPNLNSGYFVKVDNFTYTNTFEIQVKLITGSETITGTPLGQGNTSPKIGITNTQITNSLFSLRLIDTNGQNIFNQSNISYIDNQSLSLNTEYILKLKFTGTEYIYTLVDTNGTYYINRVISSSAKLRLGSIAFGVNYADVAYTAWSGGIDMKETWIKTDNKLFFNGQQA